jgi:hypothetical protein
MPRRGSPRDHLGKYVGLVRCVSLRDSRKPGAIARYHRHASSGLSNMAAAMMGQGLLWQKMPPFSLYPGG